MSDETQPEAAPALRGEKAFAAARNQVAERNEQASRAGRAERAKREQEAAASREAMERRGRQALAKGAGHRRGLNGGGKAYIKPE